MTYDYPIWYIFLSFLISGLLSFLVYRKNIKTSWKFAFMAFLRFLSLVIVFISIGGLVLNTEVENKVKPKLIVAFDQSRSMLQNADKQNLHKVFTDIYNSKLSENFRIKSIGFGEFVSKIDTLKFNQERTNIEDVERKLDLLLSESDKVILVSDGNVNSGNTSVFDTKKKYTVDVIGVGDTISKSSISITKINYNKKVIVGNSFPLELFVETSNFSGELYLEVSEKNKVIYTDKFSILPSSNINQKHRYLITMKSSKEGTHTFTVKLFSSVDDSLISQKLITVDFVKNKGVVLIKYKNPNPDISLFNREFSAENYKVVVTNKTVSRKDFSKFDFVVDFDNSINYKLNIPVVYINSTKDEDNKSLRSVETNLDKHFLKNYSINNLSKQIYISSSNLWKLKLNEAKRGENNVDVFFDNLLKDVELLKYSDKFNVVYKDIYSSSENVIVKLVNESSKVKSVDARLETVIDGKKKVFSFIEENNNYLLDLGEMGVGIHSCKVFVNDKLLKTISFEVENFDLELMGKSQNVGLLKKIASSQNGYYYNLDNYPKLIDKLGEESSNLVTIKIVKKNILEQWWMLFLLPLILGAEWLLRKRNGIY